MARRGRTHARLIRFAMLLAGVAVALAVHGAWLYSLVLTTHAAVPSALVAGAVLLAVVKHAGLAGAGYAWLHRRFNKNGGPPHG